MRSSRGPRSPGKAAARNQEQARGLAPQVASSAPGGTLDFDL